MANLKTGALAKTNVDKAGVSGAMQNAAKQTVATILNTMLDKENVRNRFQELLGKRMPSFMGSLVSLVNADENLKQAFLQSPMSVIQSALRAAAYNLPIDKSLGFAYVVPFNTKRKEGKVETWVKEAQFILGYKGMLQLAFRTGAYQRINVIDVREGELKSFDRLTEDIEIQWYESEEERKKHPIIGFLGYLRLVNGFEKKVYMTVGQIGEHEKKHRKGKNAERPAIWDTNYEAMCSKTVLRNLIGKWGLMSIDYQTADAQTLQFAQDIASGNVDDEETPTLNIEPENVTSAQGEPVAEGMMEEPPEIPFDAD